MALSLTASPMVRSVGPLMFGLGLCVIAGCASAGNDRRISLNDRPRAGMRQTSNDVSGKQVQRTAAFTPGAAAPANVYGTQPTPAPTDFADTNDEWTPSHSAEQLATISGRKSSRSNNSNVIQAGHEFDQQQTSRPLPLNVPAELPGSNVVNADFRSDRDGANGKVQLQGLQTVDPEPVNQQIRANADPWSVQVGMGEVRAAESSRDPWQLELDRLIALTERDLAAMSQGANATDQAEFRRKQIYLHLLYLIGRHPEHAVTAIPSLPPAEQEFWQKMLWAITNSLDAEEQLLPRERAANALSNLNTAMRRLREQADLSIKNAGFCEEISYFGNYKRFPREEFVPGQPVLLYAEIDNFRSEQTSTGEYRTLLRSIIEIQDANGQTRWNKTFDATEDVCRNPRRDYFHNYQFTIPESLRLGPHTLKLTVVDELSRKQSTCAIRFLVK